MVGEPKSKVKLPAPGSTLGITATSGVWVMKETTWGKLATWSTVLTVLVSTVGIVLRTLELGRTSEFFMPVPVTNTYETLAFFSWAIPLFYLFFEWRYKTKVVGVFVTGIAFILIALASSPIIDNQVRPLVPALQSYWLVVHVFFTLIGEALFAVAFGAGVLFLVLKGRPSTQEQTLKILDNVGYKAIAVGFPLFSLGGLVFGAVWAQHAWGRYWGWSDVRTAWLAVAGFAVAMFTWWGVNYLLAGLHSYAG